MRKGILKKLLYSLGGIVASFAVMVTTMSVNTTCLYIMHQPELPESTKKLRRF